MRTIIICGATATGKSDLAVALAQEIGAEIVNADSIESALTISAPIS